MTTRKEWDFRSLRQGLAMIKRDFGSEAQGWRIEDLTDRKTDLMVFERELYDALMSTHQYVVMSFKDDSPLVKKYDHYQFFVVARDENERPPTFSFSEEEEAGIVKVSKMRGKGSRRNCSNTRLVRAMNVLHIT